MHKCNVVERCRHFFELCTDLNLFLALLIAYYRPVCLNLLLLLLLQVSDGARA